METSFQDKEAKLFRDLKAALEKSKALAGYCLS